MNLAFLMLMLLTRGALAAEPIKICRFGFQVPNEESAPTEFRVIRQGARTVAEATQTQAGAVRDLPVEDVLISEHDVRDDLDKHKADLNEAEEIIHDTDEMTHDPTFEDMLSVGFDLRLVRRAKLYQIGKKMPQGGSVIVEAKGADGKDLGSFVAGFWPFPCR